MTPLFKRAVSWAFHSETEEAIRNELGYQGDMDDVLAVVNLLNKAKIDYDDVHAWSENDDSHNLTT